MNILLHKSLVGFYDLIIRNPEEAIAFGWDKLISNLHNDEVDGKELLRTYFQNKTNDKTLILIIAQSHNLSSNMSPVAYFVLNKKKIHKNLPFEYVKKCSVHNTQYTDKMIDDWGWRKLADIADNDLSYSSTKCEIKESITTTSRIQEIFKLLVNESHLRNNNKICYLYSRTGDSPAYIKNSSMKRYKLTTVIDKYDELPWNICTCLEYKNLFKYRDSLIKKYKKQIFQLDHFTKITNTTSARLNYSESLIEFIW